MVLVIFNKLRIIVGTQLIFKRNNGPLSFEITSRGTHNQEVMMGGGEPIKGTMDPYPLRSHLEAPTTRNQEVMMGGGGGGTNQIKFKA